MKIEKACPLHNRIVTTNRQVEKPKIHYMVLRHDNVFIISNGFGRGQAPALQIYIPDGLFG